MTPPRNKSSPLERWLPLLLGVAAFAFLWATQDRRVSVYDEGLVLFGAERVLRGELPYRDYWAMYPPGQFYALAWLFEAFGSSVLIERLWDTLIRAAIVVVTFRLLDRAASRAAAFVGCAFVGIWLSGLANHGFPIFPALLFTLAAAALLMDRFHGRVSLSRHFAAGACVGLATLFRHDLGLYAAVATTAVLLLHRGLASGAEARRFAPLAAFAAGGLAVTLPVFVWLSSAIPASDLWYGMIEAPARNYPRFRALPFPSWIDIFRSAARDGIGHLDHLAVHLPLLVGVSALVAFAVGQRRAARAGAAEGLEVAGRRWTLALLGALSLALFAKGMIRVSPIHLAPAILTSIATLLLLVRPRAPGPGLLTAAVALCGLILAASTLPVITRVWAHGADNAARIAGGHPCETPPGLERLRCFELEPWRVQAIQYVQAHSRPADYIYVGTIRHDRLLVNDIAFWFLSNRRSPTRWHHYEPGITTSAPVQNTIVAELTARPPALVVLSAEWEQSYEPNESRFSSGVMILDQYIADHYEPAAIFGPIAVLRRRP